MPLIIKSRMSMETCSMCGIKFPHDKVKMVRQHGENIWQYCSDECAENHRLELKEKMQHGKDS